MGSPQFIQTPRLGSAVLTALNASTLGGGTVGTDIFEILSAAGASGGIIGGVELLAVAATSTAVGSTIVRIYVSTAVGSTVTSANTYCIAEIPLPGVTAASTTIANPPFIEPLGRDGFRMPSGARILASTAVTPGASSGWRVTSVDAGDF